MLGENIKMWRQSKRYTQQEVADKLGISVKTVSSWEINRTEPNMEMLERLSIVLECNKSDLISDSVDSQKQYYLNPDVAERIQAMQSDPKLATVFDATRKVKPEDLDQVLKLIKTFTDDQ